jgi:hypothetical protein
MHDLEHENTQLRQRLGMPPRGIGIGIGGGGHGSGPPSPNINGGSPVPRIGTGSPASPQPGGEGAHTTTTAWAATRQTGNGTANIHGRVGSGGIGSSPGKTGHVHRPVATMNIGSNGQARGSITTAPASLPSVSSNSGVVPVAIHVATAGTNTIINNDHNTTTNDTNNLNNTNVPLSNGNDNNNNNNNNGKNDSSVTLSAANGTSSMTIATVAALGAPTRPSTLPPLPLSPRSPLVSSPSPLPLPFPDHAPLLPHYNNNFQHSQGGAANTGTASLASLVGSNGSVIAEASKTFDALPGVLSYQISVNNDDAV